MRPDGPLRTQFIQDTDFCRKMQSLRKHVRRPGLHLSDHLPTASEKWDRRYLLANGWRFQRSPSFPALTPTNKPLKISLNVPRRLENRCLSKLRQVAAAKVCGSSGHLPRFAIRLMPRAARLKKPSEMEPCFLNGSSSE